VNLQFTVILSEPLPSELTIYGQFVCQLYDEDFGSRDVYCGTRRDLEWQSKGNKVKVVFASNQAYSDLGFLASYRFVAP
jgi:hypothetical protein